MKCIYHHTHICCEDLQRSEKWWIEVMGAELNTRIEVSGSPITKLNIGGTMVFLSPKIEGMDVELRKDNPCWGLCHIAFAVEDMRASISELRAKGVEIMKGPIETMTGTTIAYVQAPDGVEVELLQPK